MSKNSQNHQNNDLASRKKAEQVILSQLDQIYGVTTAPDDTISAETEVNSTQSASQTTPEPTQNTTQDAAETHLNTNNLYNQTYQQAEAPTADWQAYHSAWQNYYQKYYEYYYTEQFKQQASALKDQFQAQKSTSDSSPNQTETATINHRDQALRELRDNLRSKMTTSAQKARKSRHFWPFAAASAAVLVFLFLQYNRFLVGQVRAYITPADTSQSTIIVDPTVSIGVGPDPRIIIPKINVNVPVAYDIGNDNASQQEAMKHGVAHFAVPGASSHPGEIGNTPISGHSSNDVFEQGDYKFIFAQLDRLQTGDLIYADYQGTRYTYSVTKKETVWPNEWEKLVYPTTKPVMTLITCTPIGTTLQRLLVTAEQISPDPELAAQPSAPSINITKQPMPGESPSFLERLFGK